MPMFRPVIFMGDLQIVCDLDYRFPTTGVHTLPNGDPGFPDEPEEGIVTAACLILEDGSQIDIMPIFETLGEEAEEKLNELALEAARDDIDASTDPGDDKPGDQFKPDTWDED